MQRSGKENTYVWRVAPRWINTHAPFQNLQTIYKWDGSSCARGLCCARRVAKHVRRPVFFYMPEKFIMHHCVRLEMTSKLMSFCGKPFPFWLCA